MAKRLDALEKLSQAHDQAHAARMKNLEELFQKSSEHLEASLSNLEARLANAEKPLLGNMLEKQDEKMEEVKAQGAEPTLLNAEAIPADKSPPSPSRASPRFDFASSAASLSSNSAPHQSSSITK